MQTEEFNKLATGTKPFTEETVNGLRELVEAHPSFQLAWLLYLKNLKEIESPDFESVLKMVAVRLSDRKLLYRYLKPEGKKNTEKINPKTTIPFVDDIEVEDNTKIEDSLIDKFLQSDHGVIRQNPDDPKDFKNE